MKRVLKYKPRRIDKEDFIDEVSKLEQYPLTEDEISYAESLNQDDTQNDIQNDIQADGFNHGVPSPQPPPTEELSLEQEGSSLPIPKKRGRPRKTESTKKIPPPKSFEAEIERIRKKKGTPLTKMVQMRLKGLTIKEIADKLGMKYNTVLVTMKNLFNILDREKLIAFEKYRNEIYSAVEFELLDLMLDPKKKKEAKLQNIAYAFDRIYNARRLEQGKSTTNIGFHALIEEMERRRENQILESSNGENHIVEVAKLESG